MIWTQPIVAEISVGMEINGYASAELPPSSQVAATQVDPRLAE